MIDHRLLEQKTMPITKTNLIRLAAAAVLFGASGAVLAFPCYVSDGADPVAQGYVDGSASLSTELDVALQDQTDDYVCDDGPADESNESEALLNAGSYFGLTGWSFIDKYDPGTGGGVGTEGVIEIDNFSATDPSDGLPLAGNWAFLDSNIWTDYSNVLIVLKDGGKTNEAGEKVFWSAYHVTNGDMSGDFSMPLDGLSHIYVYGITGGEPPGETPTPAPIALLGLGTLLLGWRSRKSSS
jgi:hypothetical protein